MRTIKFRAWDEPSKTMFYKDVQDLFIIDGVVFMQFTGLKDKNGKEIYEGDILYTPEFKTEEGTIFERKIEIEWNEGENGWNFERSDAKRMKVIGNIYENKDLIK